MNRRAAWDRLLVERGKEVRQTMLHRRGKADA